MHCLGSILGEERIEEIVEIIFFFGSNLSQNIMVSIYVTLLQFFIREQMTHLGPIWGVVWLHLIYQCGKGIVKISLL